MHRLPFTDLFALASALVDIARKRKPKPGKPKKPPRKRKPKPGKPKKPPRKRKPKPGDGLLAFLLP